MVILTKTLFVCRILSVQHHLHIKTVSNTVLTLKHINVQSPAANHHHLLALLLGSARAAARHCLLHAPAALHGAVTAGFGFVDSAAEVQCAVEDPAQGVQDAGRQVAGYDLDGPRPIITCLISIKSLF